MSSEILGGSAVTPAEPAVEAAGSRLLRNISMLAGGQLTTWVLTGLWTIVVPRGIGPRGMGLLVTAWAAAGIMSVMVGLGTRDLLVRRIAVNPAEAPAIVGTAITLRALLSLPGLLLVLAFASFTGFGPEQRLVLMFFSGTTLLLLLLEPIQAAFQALERMKYLAYADVLAKAGVSAGGIALVLFGFGPVALVALGCSIGVVILALNLVWSLPGRWTKAPA